MKNKPRLKLIKKKEQKEDGRYIIYYTFEEKK